MDLAAIRELVTEDMQAVDRAIQDRLRSDVVLINQLGAYIVNSGGKRLRPMVVLLTARAAGYGGDRHIPLAAIVELIHTATLLHDDVVDGSDQRRGQDTANHIWGNEASVLVGDFLYTRSFQMMVELGSTEAMETFARATNTIAEGEVLQLLNVHDADVDEARYREVIYRKTAALFEAGCRLAALFAGGDDTAAAAYGRHLGTAFQLIDDALDYDGNPAEIGKNVGDDLAEGKPTMPLIRAMEVGDEHTRALIREAIEAGGRERITAVCEAIANTDAIAYTRRLAEEEARQAEAALTFARDDRLREALAELARFAADRRH
ncbi:Octaprenyl diphosphate synthase [wastewater metagenome]|uniref:Octaprenyl diphosphate synthase n=2 Tax=unclassified sequences TaxID=12908 RepID=A0A5B8RCM2_9ZZZZ|nr:MULTISPECIES: polyprenyl synthetase family protein [Arhodomonas]MCS4503806.1 polyprenyl synthetase family protein [Arhodomonas aquaeolei]QEA05668.1 octaprenyl diphosphate synthase [uncultured organism]